MTMQYTHLGRSGATVSRLALGTMNFGWHADEADSGAIMDRALDVGINFFDTADVYSRGGSKEIIGRWLAADKTRRDKVLLGPEAGFITGSDLLVDGGVIAALRAGRWGLTA